MSRNDSQQFAPPVDRAASHLKPYKQGQFDNLCGLYAILNAMQLAAYPVQPMTDSKARALFEAGAVYLRKEHSQLHPLAKGMSNSVMHRLAQHLTTVAGTRKITFSLIKYPGPDDTNRRKPFLDWIEHNLGIGHPVISCLYKPAHFTVLSRVSRAGLILFDSQDLTRLKIPKRDLLTDHLDGDAGIVITAIGILGGDEMPATEKRSATNNGQPLEASISGGMVEGEHKIT